MHMLDAVLVHQSLCNSVKRTLAVVTVWFINMVCVLYMFIRFCVVFSGQATNNLLWFKDELKTQF